MSKIVKECVMKQFSVIFMILVSSVLSLDINTDGSIRQVPYEPAQQKELEELGKDIIEYQAKFREFLPYLKLRKLITHDSYTAEGERYIKHDFAAKTKYFIQEYAIYKINGENISEITFRTRKGLLGSDRPNITEYRDIMNTNTAGYENIQIKIHTFGEGHPETIIYDLQNIREPRERLKLVRAYRNNLERSVRQLDQKIQQEIKNATIEVNKVMNNLKQ